LNKSSQEKIITLNLKSPAGSIKMVADDLLVAQNDLLQSAFFIEIPKSNLQFVNTPVIIEVFAGKELIEEIKTSFMGPEKWKNTQVK
jgi:hypothetical protein